MEQFTCTSPVSPKPGFSGIGGGLVGAGSGAASGAVAGPWGAAVGAIAGFFKGLFGGGGLSNTQKAAILQQQIEAQEAQVKYKEVTLPLIIAGIGAAVIVATWAATKGRR